MLKKSFAESKENLIRTSDSCYLVGSILVQTIMGPISISALARIFEAGKSLPDVLSWNPTINLTCWKKIIKAWKVRDDKKLLSRTYKTIIVKTELGLCLESTPKYSYQFEGTNIVAENLRIKQKLMSIGPAYSGLMPDKIKSVKIFKHHQPIVVYGIEVADTHLLAITNPWAFHCIVVYDSEFAKEMRI